MTIQSRQSSRTYTFLFADLEGSTRLWEQFPQVMKAAMERHDALLRGAVEAADGEIVKTTGDGMMAVFASALDGVSACLNAQTSLLNEPWGEIGQLQVRMGLHVGEAQPRGGDYYGQAVNRAARLMSAAHGGQVLLSAVAASLVRDLLPQDVTLRDLGEHRLKDLAQPEHIFQLVHPHLTTDFPPLATLNHRPNNIPSQPTPLIGREAELSEIIKRLKTDEVRLLTLTGPGGIGKTRMGLQAAAELIDHFDDGVWFVDLAPVRDPNAVPSVITQTLGLRETSDRPLLDELKEQLRAKKMLLLLDNFEQVMAAAPQVVELLRDCPQLKILVTSREALHVRDEYVFPVPPLALPKDDIKQPLIEQISQYEAVRLFIERAQAVNPDFKVTNENAPAVAEICVRLDGLPLAIELAAARVRLFAPQALLERLGSRLKLLRGGARDLPVRQQTLRESIDWSYELLDAGEQRLFELLSVFPGGCSLEAVEGVGAGGIQRLEETQVEILDGLASLVDKSLIRQVEQEGGTPRLLMLETIREFAAERLAADPAFHAAVCRAHAAYYAAFARQWWERLASDGQEAVLRGISADLENLRAAWRHWVGEKDLDQLGKFIDSLWLLYDVRGWYHAAIDLTTDMLSILSSTPATPERDRQRIVLQTSLARALLATKGYTPEVEAAYQQALELAQSVGEIPQLFPVLRGLANLYVYLGENDQAAEMGAKILSLADSLDDESMRVEGHLVLGYSLAFQGYIKEGLGHLDQAWAGYDPDRFLPRGFQIGNNPGVVSATVSSLLLWMRGFPDRALQRGSDSVALAKRLNHPYSMAYALFHSGYLHLWRREIDQVYERAQAVFDIADKHEFHVWKAVAQCLRGAALSRKDRLEEGLAQIRQGIKEYQLLNTPPVFWSLLRLMEAEVWSQMGKPEQGLAILDELDEAIRLDSGHFLAIEALRLRGRLLLALSPDHAPEAEVCFQRAVEAASRLDLLMMELRAAVSLFRLWSAQGKAGQGRRLLSGIYGRFTEGFTTADLVEAKALIDSDS